MSEQVPVVLSGRYELHRRIARGGMAEVYLARDQLLDRPVAIKILVPEFATDSSFVERFRREAQAAANLNHPNIVGVYDWGREAGTHFIVMEYVDGRSLAEILRTEGTLHPDRGADIATDVAAALGFAHRNGVVHRDVKPGNVLISTNGVVKVTDFGIARAVTSGAEENLTQTGSVMGTATYFSPEQAQGKAVDPRSDLYSLGVVMYEMAAGKPPFSGDSPVAIAYKHVQEQPPPLHLLNDEVPPSYEAITQKLLAKNPANRYASAEELRADLRRFREGQPVFAEGVLDPPVAATAAVGGMTATRAMGGTTVIPPPGSTTSTATIPAAEEQPPRRTGWLVAIAVILLAALGVGLFSLARSLGIGDGPTVAVPDVRNQSALVAKTLLSAKGFNVDSGIQYAYSHTVPFNDVIDTKPSVGSKVAKNSLITLIVSAGPPVTVPANAIGADASAVTAQLQQQNPNIKITPAYAANNDFDSGKVINTSPPPGEQPRPGTGVTLLVSTGPSSKVPDVTGLDAGQAASILTGAGYQVGSTAGQYSGSLGNGAVIATSPSANTPLKPGSTVNLVVSLGLPPTTTTTTAAPTTTTPTTRPTTTTTRRPNPTTTAPRATTTTTRPAPHAHAPAPAKG